MREDTFQEFCDGETVSGHMEKVDEVPIVMVGTLIGLVHYLHLPW